MVPASAHVEIEPLKQEGIIVDPNQKFEESGKILALPTKNKVFECDAGNLHIGDIIYFDSYACRATTEINGKKHYFVSTSGGGIYAIEHVEEITL